jgi:citrate lyase subunit beta/citryl-CoA lyase
MTASEASGHTPVSITRPRRPPIRSLLYVPGNKLDWMLKAPRYGSDALILDLEDSVPPDQKVQSRALVQRAIDELGHLHRPKLFARMNALATGLAEGDLEAVVRPGLFAIEAPKIDGPEDMRTLDALLSDLESRAGLPVGQTAIMPLTESARAMREAYEIAMASPRVAYLFVAGGSGDGDMARVLGFRETPGRLETLYVRSKIVLDARAAGVFPICGLLGPLADLEGLSRQAEEARDLGFTGSNVVHPSHVPIVNRAFSPKQSDLDHWREIVATVEEGQRRGTAAVAYKGKMLDIAHLSYAREMLDLASSYLSEEPSQ